MTAYRSRSGAACVLVMMALVLAACEVSPSAVSDAPTSAPLPASAAARAFGDGTNIDNFRDVAFGATIEIRKTGIPLGERVPTLGQLEAIQTFIDSTSTDVTRPAIEQSIAFSILNPVFVADDQRFSPRTDLAPHERTAVRYALDLLVRHQNPTVDLLYAALQSVQSDLPAEVVEETAGAIAEAYDARLSASKRGCISCGYGREARTAAYTDARSALDAYLGG